MATTTKTWAFAADAEGLADGGNSGVVFGFLSSDGNPTGCVRFTQGTKGATATEFARRSTGETWETWGVPSGSTVTAVEITGWQKKLAANTKLSSHSFKARVIGSGGGTVHSAGELADWSLATTVDATWQGGAANNQRAVDANFQASTTDVRLELEYTVTTSGGGGSASVDQRFDQIVLTITYEAASVSVTVAGASAGVSTAAASTSILRSLTASSAGLSTAAATLTVAGIQTLAGTSAAVSTASGATVLQRVFSALVAADSAVAGAVANTIAFAGRATGLSSVSGSTAGTVSLAGTVTAVSAVTGDLYTGDVVEEVVAGCAQNAMMMGVG